MPDINFESIFNSLKSGVIQLAGQAISGYIEQAKNAGLALVENIKDDLELWTAQVASGEMSVEELKDLVKGQVTDVKLAALYQAGIAQIDFDKFKKGLVDLITNTISTLI